MIAGSHGLTYEATTRAAERLAGAERLVLPDYAAPGWADVIADRTDAVADRMTDFLARHAADTARPPAREGAVAGITYRMRGSGPPLILLPFFLAPPQWAPALRSDERRVGKEWFRTCRSRGAPGHLK